MGPSLFDACFLAGAAFVAGSIDAVAGGGGLITVPALFAVKLPPHLAFGTNKGQSVFGSGASLVRYWRAGLVDASRAPLAFFLGFAGSLAGASLLLSLPPRTLRLLVLVLLFGAALFIVLRRPHGPTKKPPLTPARRLGTHAVTLALGAYDGFFGPGTGTFLIVTFVGLLGETLQRASANAKVVNFGSNLAALILFWHRGVIVWSYAVPMAMAQLAGGTFGAHLGVKVGDRLVRRVLLAVSFALMLKIAFDLVRG